MSAHTIVGVPSLPIAMRTLATRCGALDRSDGRAEEAPRGRRKDDMRKCERGARGGRKDVSLFHREAWHAFHVQPRFRTATWSSPHRMAAAPSECMGDIGTASPTLDVCDVQGPQTVLNSAIFFLHRSIPCRPGWDLPSAPSTCCLTHALRLSGPLCAA